MPPVRWKDKTVISPDDDQDRIPITDDTDSSDKYTTATRILGDGLKAIKDEALTPDAYGMSFLELTSDTEAQQLINVEPGVDVQAYDVDTAKLDVAQSWTARQTFSSAVVPTYTVGTLPSASPAAQVIYVSDETGGAILAFSDGTDWRRVTDRAVVS